MKPFNNILTVSNVLSIIRFILIVPTAYYLWNDNIVNAGLFFTLALITDFFDGYLARKWNQITELGKVIDPLADKTLLFVIVLILVIKGVVPIWFIILVALRDIAILIGGLVFKNIADQVPASNFPGKIAFAFTGIVILTSLIGFNEFQFYGLIFSILLLYYSLTIYLARIIKIKRKGNHQ